MLSNFGKREWLTILATGSILTVSCLMAGWWLTALVVILATGAALSFFRDPKRITPTQRGVMISPADGRVSSIHQMDHFEPFDGPATCIRIFLSVLNVHVNRSPCHGWVQSIRHKPGQHLNALNPESAEVNESNLIVLRHPTHRHPVAAVRQVAGLIARKIVCGVAEGQIVQRGQRIGMIKFGSTTELYIPQNARPEVSVQQGQRVFAGTTILATLASSATSEASETTPASTQEPSETTEVMTT